MHPLTLRALRAAARRPLVALALVVALPAAVSFVASARHGSAPAPVDAAANERQILGRVWFDKYPEKSTDVVEIWIWLGGGIGVHERGSSWRLWSDLFEFERQGDKLTMSALQDKKETVRRFTVAKCDDAPAPFDLCLTLDEKLGGQKRYYGFSYDDDMDAHVPWARSVKKAAEARAAGPR
ncbi:MAG TPA: hypothetical protein VGM56_33955 [Byssovorax sp.]|jgi:hypothetical protein